MRSTPWPKLTLRTVMVSLTPVLLRAISGSHRGSPLLLALSEAGRFALQRPEVIELGPTHAARAHHVDVIDHLGVHRKNALHSLAEADLADGDGLAHTRVIAGDQRTLKGLEAFFVAFLDLYVDPQGVAGPELGDAGPQVLLDEFRQQRVLHVNSL